jgi:heptosyltransferase-3
VPALVRRIERPLVVLLLGLVRALARRAKVPGPPRSILIVRVDERVGNVLLTTPLVAPLRARFPEARLTMLVARSKLAIVRELVEAIPFDKKDSYRAPFRFIRALWALRSAGYDVAIDASHAHQFSVTSALLLGWTGAPLRIAHDRGRAGDVANALVPPAPETMAEVDGKMTLLLPLGIEGVPGRMTTTLGTHDQTVARWRAEQGLADATLLGLVPGGRKAGHRVEAAVFIGLAQRARARGVTPLVLWGPGEEALAAQVVSEGGAVLAPPSDLEALAALMRACAVVVSNDTGPMHLAVAVGTPTVGVFARPSAPRWGHDYPPHQVVAAAGRPAEEIIEAADRAVLTALAARR